jgi:hypothetical protein
MLTSTESISISSGAPTPNRLELQRLQNQKLLKYSPSDNFSPELEREIDDMIAKAAYNESQKTFQQMSQKESLTLAKDIPGASLNALKKLSTVISLDSVTAP